MIMAQYNNIETAIARHLNRVPILKQFAKHIYSRLSYLANKKGYAYSTSANFISISLNDKASFFGYYDKTPESRDKKIVVCLTSDTTKSRPSSSSKIDVALFSAPTQILFTLPVRSFNWQQGCRAHWLTHDWLIYNDLDSDHTHYISNVFDASKQKIVRSFNYPVQDSFGTRYFISLNYRRLMALRPDYGYRNLPPLTPSELACLDDDGLWRIEFESGESKLLISLRNACELAPKTEFKQAKHLFNHVLISPDGERLIFMHRYFLGRRRFDRLLLADAASGDIKLLADYGMVSHCFWADNHTILGYLRGPGSRDGYWLLDINTGAFTPFGVGKIDQYGDGHPHVHGDWFVTDTYPDKARMQHLLLCNWKTGEVKHIGEFFHGFQYAGEARCDLHPRFSPDGKFIFFDSVFTGQRQLYRMEVPQ